MFLNQMKNVFLGVLFVSFCLFSCKDGGEKIRVISDKDTSFSSDVRSISKKINNDPSNADLYFKRANTFFFEEKINDAVIDISYACVLDSMNPIYFFTKGQYLIAKDSADASLSEKSYLKAIALKKDYYDAHSNLAYLYLAKQKYPEAEAAYFEASKIDPSNPNPLFYLGMIAKETNDTAKALKYFEKTLAYDSKHYNALMQMGLYYAEKKDEKALLFLNNAIAVNEFSDEALYAKGLFLQKKGNYKEAILFYESVSRINPAHIFCRYNLAVLFAIQNDFENALKYIDEAIELDETNPDLFYLRAKINDSRNDPGKAKRDFEKAESLAKK